MISNRKDYAAVIEILKFDKCKYFVFNKNNYASMIYYAEYVAGDDSCRRIAFQDTTRAGAERQDYIKAIAAGKVVTPRMDSLKMNYISAFSSLRQMILIFLRRRCSVITRIGGASKRTITMFAMMRISMLYISRITSVCKA